VTDTECNRRMGGDAEIIPERAPGRTLSVKEEEREVALGRYGADLEMNTNLLLEPALAKADLDIKLNYQKAALERKLDELGYEAVMREGTDLIRALAEASPIHFDEDADKVKYMEHVYAKSIFGCMEKHSQPIANLLAAAKKAGTMSAGDFDTMIVPSGLQELLQWTRAENVYYYLNGRAIDQKEKIQFGLDGGRVDPSSGLRVFTTYPKVDYSQGTAYQSAIKSNIMNERTVGLIHYFTDEPVIYIVDHKTGATQQITYPDYNPADRATTFDNIKPENRKVYVRQVKVLMSSAILAKSGSETGEMLMAYPNTAFTNDNTSPEVFKLQLRVYLGAAVYVRRCSISLIDWSTSNSPPPPNPFILPQQPNNIMILPDVHFEGVLDSGLKTGRFRTQSMKTIVPQTAVELGILGDDVAVRTEESGAGTRGSTNPYMYFPGATYADAAGLKQLCANYGHFGSLDSPAGAAKMASMNVFTSDAGGK
jgi:hypothetical protein